MNKQQIREIVARRGWVLRILHQFRAKDSKAMNDRLILDGVQQVGYAVSEATLRADLEYLEEKGYVKLERESAPFRVLIAEMTAQGEDLYMGLIDDPGVDFLRQD